MRAQRWRQRLILSIPILVSLAAGLPETRAQEGTRGLRGTAPSGRRLAFLVGINTYASLPTLRNAVNDASDLTKALRAVDFEVETQLDVPLETLERQFEAFARRVEPGDIVLFYFSGHGIQIDDENYLLPADFDAPHALGAKRRSLSASYVLERLDSQSPLFKVLLLDACRDNPFQKQGTRSAKSGLAGMIASGALVGFATAPGSTASDNPGGRNGLFTEHLLRNITVTGREAVDALRQVQMDVHTASSGQQLPWINVGYAAPFYFVPAPAESPTRARTRTEEDGFWDAASSSRDPRLLDEYLQKYGDRGRHVVQAKLLRANFTEGATGSPGSAGRDRPTVAVLGFRNSSGKAETGWISTALADSINSELAVERRLRPLSGEEVSRMKRDLSLPDADALAADTLKRIRQNSNADLVVLGSYVALGGSLNDPIRLNVLIQDTRAGATLAAFSLVGNSGDGLFDLISQAGARIRTTFALEPRSSDQAALVRAAVPQQGNAVRSYAEGLRALREFDAQSARDRFLDAIRSEPGFALAHSALARAWQMLGQDNDAITAARRALELASGLSEEHRLSVEARAAEMSRQWSDAIRAYRELADRVSDDPEYAILLAQAQQSAGDAKGALETVERLYRSAGISGSDPRIDVAAAEALAALSRIEDSRTAAARAAEKALAGAAWGIVARARILESFALLKLGRRNEARAAAEDARRLYITAGDRRGVARALIEIGENLRTAGQLDQAEALFRESLEITRALGNRRHTARALDHVGTIAFGRGDFMNAHALFAEAAAINGEIGDRLNQAMALNNDAAALYELGDVRRALAAHEQALAIRRDTGDLRGTAMSLVNIAECRSDQGELTEAKRLYQEAAAISTRIDDHSEVAYAMWGLGGVLSRQGRTAEASASHEAALRLRVKLSEQHGIVESRLAIAETQLDEGDVDAAHASVVEILRSDRIPPDLSAYAHALLVRLLVRQGKFADADRAAAKALEARPERLSRPIRFRVGLAVARVEARTGRADAALKRVRTLTAEAERFPAFHLAARLVEGEILMMSGDPRGRGILTGAIADAQRAGFELLAAQGRHALDSGQR